jgi:hypothetical protein
MTIVAKFPGRCTACGCGVKTGEQIVWTRGAGIRHATEPQCFEAKKANAGAPAPFDGKPLREFLQRAVDSGLKRPKARFLGPDGQTELRLSLATSTKNKDAIYIALGGEYMGLVTVDGAARGSFLRDQDLIDVLTAIVADPALAAKKYGALMCKCSFCGLPLTDDGSVMAGYGPICAKKWHLPHMALGTLPLLPVPTAADIEKGGL